MTESRSPNAVDELDLPPDLREFAFQRYGETPETRKQKLAEMRQQISALPSQDQIKDTSDKNLIRFLRVRKFRVNEAVENTVNLVKFEKDYPDYMGGTPKEFRMYSKFMQILEQRDPEGRTVLILRSKLALENIPPEFHQDHPLGRCQIMVLDRLSHDVYVQVGVQ
jgi:hypothetical protein